MSLASQTKVKPVTYLILSADIIDSTRAKSERPDGWFKDVKAFYDDFPLDVVKACASRLDRCHGQLVPRPWKRVGDEILFQAPLKRLEAVFYLCGGFRDAIRTFNSSKLYRFRLKATGWLVTTPVRNHVDGEPDFEGPLGAPGAVDFLGPSVDLGFRVTKSASYERFAVSADLACALLEAGERIDDNSSLRLYLTDFNILKGIRHPNAEGEMDDVNYPVVWIDALEIRKTDRDADVLHKGRQPIHHELVTYLRRFLKQYPRFKSFIPGRKIPQDVVDGWPAYRQWMYDEDARGLSEDEPPAIGDPIAPPDPAPL